MLAWLLNLGFAASGVDVYTLSSACRLSIVPAGEARSLVDASERRGLVDASERRTLVPLC